MGQYLHSSDLNDVKIHSVLLGEGIKGFVYVSKKNVSHVFIGESLSPECTAETLAHEVYHIKYDKTSHGIGMDVQLEEFEQKANRFATLNTDRLLVIMRSTPT